MHIRQTLIKHHHAAAFNEAFTALRAINPTLLLIFGDISFFQPEVGLIQHLASAFPETLRLGCSTAGEVRGPRIEEKSLVITAVRFNSVKTHAAHAFLPTMADSEHAGTCLAQALPSSTRAVMVWAPGIHINGSAVIEGLRRFLPAHAPVTGGLAGDGGAFKTTYTLFNEIISDRQAIALGLEGEALRFYHGSYGGWQPFGPPRQVTRCEANVLYELDGEPAIAVYKQYLGEHAKGLPATSLLFPFAILDEKHHDTGLIRTISGIDEARGSLILAGDVQEHSYLKLMHASTDRLVDGAHYAAKNLIEQNDGPDSSASLPTPGLGLLISCVGRKLVMGDRVDEELEAVARLLPPSTVLSGFYSYGEISPYHATLDCKLHNQTMTITYISEL